MTQRKVDYPSYEGKYDENIKAQMETAPESVDVETMRAVMYGYTFTEEYKRNVLADELCMDYWAARAKSEQTDDIDDEYNGLDLVDGDIDIEDMEVLYCVSSPQEELLLRTIDSTGNGMTAETALCVIDVSQEYDYMGRVFPYCMLEIDHQSLLDGNVDCIEFRPNPYGVKKLYFDISSKFKVYERMIRLVIESAKTEQ